jgi:hypothetical protein
MKDTFRSVVFTTAVLCVIPISESLADEPTPSQPTSEQLKATKEAFAALGARYHLLQGDPTKETVHYFSMPASTTDADLKRLPPIPFSLQLNLSDTQITDRGLTELKKLKGISWLNIGGTKVTDAGLKE